MNLVRMDMNNCIVNLANSVMKHFGLKNYHETLSCIDRILAKNYQNVIVILYDGMGNSLYKRALPNSFLEKHQIATLTSVHPATTTASTTSMRSGLYPSEHNWLGWDLYIKPLDKIVTLFTNKLKDSDEEAGEDLVAERFMPFKNIVSLINESGGYAKELFPFGNDFYQNLDEMYQRIIDETKKDGKKYIYAYYPEPDGIMHEYGTDTKKMQDCLKELNQKTEELCQQLNDSAVIITADHGHLNCDDVVISQYPDFLDTLDGDVSIEARFCSFKVKNREKFEKLFRKYFGNDFLLKTHEEIINEEWFGKGEHEEFRNSIGDYVAIGITNKYFRYSEKSESAVSMHAGITEEEMLIPLIVIENK